MGHVSVNLALIPRFCAMDWEIHYIGSKSGIEKDVVTKIPGVSYHEIETGKLRRYFDVKNVTDVFRVVKGMAQARTLLKKIRPDVVFSKGGFVSFPVVFASKGLKIPSILHESDLTIGLANKLSLPFCSLLLTTFEDTQKHIQSIKTQFVGGIVREEVLGGNKERGRNFLRFERDKPILLVMGGSLGARSVNQALRDNLVKITELFNVAHICGGGNTDESIESEKYRQFDYLNEELPDVLAACDMVLSRAGANAIFEFLALNKPMLLVPLPKSSSRGDQIFNAQYFQRKGYAIMLEDEKINSENLFDKLLEVYMNGERMSEKMRGQKELGSISQIVEIILDSKL